MTSMSFSFRLCHMVTKQLGGLGFGLFGCHPYLRPTALWKQPVCQISLHVTSKISFLHTELILTQANIGQADTSDQQESVK